MLWSIILIPKNNKGWYLNYIENKLINQINTLKLEKEIEIVIFDKNLQFLGEYVSVVDNVEISNNFIELIYNKLQNCKKDCIGLKAISYMDNVPFEIDLPISKLNPIKSDIILKIQNFNYYINSDNLSNLVKTIDNLNTPVIFYEDLKKQPFSIIISAYKSQEYIEECLDSIENQTYFKDNDNYEILVGVDGCQDTLDKLQEIKHKYRNLHIYMMSENKGTYITCNTLIDLIKNENVIKFDSDDVMTPNMINEVARNIQDNDIMILGSLDLTNGIVGTNFLLTEGVIYFRKSVMDIAGGYQPWICSADTELIKRLVNKVKITQLKKALFHRRLHSESLTQKEGTRYNSDLREGYKKLIKPHYKDNEIKIERVVNKYIDTENIEEENNGVSVIVSAFKSQKFIEECLDSIENQTYFKYNSFEILVGVDSCQETFDKVKEIAHKYKKLRIFWFPKNVGTYIVKNTLSTYAQYNKLSFFDSDDIMDYEYISIGLSQLKRKSIFRIKYRDFNDNNINNFKLINYHAHGVILIYKKDFLELNGFWNQRIASDLDFLNRCKLHGILDIKYDGYLMMRRLHNNNISFDKNVGMNTLIRNNIHIEIESRVNNKIIINNELVISYCEEILTCISFCVPAYKSSNFIEDCLDSIEKQKCKKEILVGIDSCQETYDKIKKIAYKYKSLRIFWFPKNVGTSIVKNTLATNAKYNILSFFDSDDIMVDNYSEYVLKNITYNNIIRFKYRNFDNKNTTYNVSNECANGVISVYKNIFLKVNGYWKYRVSEDFDFIKRCEGIGVLDTKIPYIGINRRIHENNISYNSKTGCILSSGKKTKLGEKLYNLTLNNISNNIFIYSELITSICNEINIINIYFDKIFCVNLDRRPDKWKKVKTKFDKLGIDVIRFSAIDGNEISKIELDKYKINKFEVGCKLSHYSIIKNAKENNYNRILILEDDVNFIENFNQEFKNIICKIKDWKMFYLGATQYQWGDIEFIDNFYYSNHCDGTFAYALDKSIYDDILNQNETSKPIDYNLWDIQKKYYNNCYTCFPNLIIADVSDSDIRNRREVDDHNIKMKWNLKKYE